MALRTLMAGKSPSLRLGPRLQLAASAASRPSPPPLLPDLPYDYGSRQPAISGEIMQLHRQAYVANSNEALEQLHDAIKFNGGGHVNHSIVWNNLAPIQAGGGEPPKGSLGWAIDNHFGLAL
ncbi:hypothetical protein NL676_035238 [Syzygium grande]|nr:hypothetical protein NL676_035238 [Syzygium grande]